MKSAPPSPADASPWKHSHGFGQDIKNPGETRTMIVIAITATAMVVEIAAGILFGSMALLADGIHMASHALALGINAFAYVYARRHARNPQFSFGTGKVNALGGYSGGILLALFAAMMAGESVRRLLFPTEIAFDPAIIVATIGLLVNGASMFILRPGHHDRGHDHHHDLDHRHDHNLRSAYLHVFADALTSVTAIAALFSAKYFGWIWMDPLMGIAGSLLVGIWSLGLLRQSSHVLLDRQTSSDLTDQIREAIEGDGHTQVADLHVWAIAPHLHGVILTVVTPEAASPDEYRQRLDRDRFPHVTVEVHASASS